MSVTIYKGDFGFLREVRRINLGVGKVILSLRDVAERIEPETVRLRSLTASGALSVQEQNFRYDLLTPGKLLEKYAGRRVSIHKDDDALGAEQTLPAEVLSVEGGAPVFRIGGETTTGPVGRVSFPDVPPALVARPTLVVLLGSEQPTQDVELEYVTKKLNWRADYALRVDERLTKADLQAWVTITNGSGASFENARVQLVAGDHEYSLGRPTSLLDREAKQVLLLQAAGVAIAERFEFENQLPITHLPAGRTASDRMAVVSFDIENSESNHLGLALPAGVVRVYAPDGTGEAQAIGEDNLGQTPRGETFRIRAGHAAGVRGDHTQLSIAPMVCGSESEWEVVLRNHRDSAAVVDVVERTVGDWELLSSSQPLVQSEARAFTFRANVPGRGESMLRYRVRQKWCRR